MQFHIDDQIISIVDEFVHLGHTIVSLLDDNKEILTKRNELCGKINNVLCYFKSCDPVVKIKLLRSYCKLSDFYGSVLSDMSLNTVENVCTAYYGERALGVYGNYHFRLTLGLLHQFVSCYRLKMNFCSAVCPL